MLRCKKLRKLMDSLDKELNSILTYQVILHFHKSSSEHLVNTKDIDVDVDVEN